MSAPRPPYDRWRDVDGIHIPDGAWVEQVEVAKEHGALRRRLGKRGEVVGRGRSNRLYVRFAGEDHRVSIRPHLVRVVTVAAHGPRNTEQIIGALQALAAEHCGGLMSDPKTEHGTAPRKRNEQPDNYE